MTSRHRVQDSRNAAYGRVFRRFHYLDQHLLKAADYGRRRLSAGDIVRTHRNGGYEQEYGQERSKSGHDFSAVCLGFSGH